MASLGIRCGGNHPVVHDHHRLDRNFISRFGYSFPISNRISKRSPQRIRASSAATTTSKFPLFSPSYIHQVNDRKFDGSGDGDGGNGVGAPEKIDEWMRDSVVEIVRNLKRAPLLVQIHGDNNNNNDGDDRASKIKTEKAFPDEWRHKMTEWNSGEKPSPDGIIFVEELDDNNNDGDEGDGLTRVWGLIVQGNGSGLNPVCYLLKTSRVGSGCGLFCTHFCLMKVKSLRESALSQLTDCWLLQ